jgi:hypothetical protein
MLFAPPSPQDNDLPKGVKAPFPLAYSATSPRAATTEFLFGADVLGAAESQYEGSTDALQTKPIMVPQGVSGSGKTKTIANLALRSQNPLWVLYTDCATVKDEIAAELEEVLREFSEANPPPMDDPSDPSDPSSNAYRLAEVRSKRLDNRLQSVFLRRVAAQLYVLAWMLKHEKLVLPCPRAWFHYCVTRGASVVNIVAVLLKPLPDSDLQPLVTSLEQQIPGGIIVAWDEAQVLFDVLRGQVMRRLSKDSSEDGSDVGKEEAVWFTSDGELDTRRTVSAFALVCRVSRPLGRLGMVTYVAGTAFRD